MKFFCVWFLIFLCLISISLRSQGDNKFEIVYIYHPKINPTTFFEMVHLQSELSSLIFWKIYNLVCLRIPSSKHQVFLRQVPPLQITCYCQDSITAVVVSGNCQNPQLSDVDFLTVEGFVFKGFLLWSKKNAFKFLWIEHTTYLIGYSF